MTLTQPLETFYGISVPCRKLQEHLLYDNVRYLIQSYRQPARPTRSIPAATSPNTGKSEFQGQKFWKSPIWDLPRLSDKNTKIRRYLNFKDAYFNAVICKNKTNFWILNWQIFWKQLRHLIIRNFSVKNLIPLFQILKAYLDYSCM